ncbi:MAG: oligoendopeptidase F [Clostridia bacterium]|nr:oligoendopeptidase F [Clostridia bacterium]
MEKLKKRSEIDSRFQWDLSDMIKNEEQFLSTIKQVESLAEEFSNYSGTLNQGAGRIRDCLDLYAKTMSIMENLVVYSLMKSDEDNALSKSQVDVGKTQQLMVKTETIASFLEPELVAIDENILFDDQLKEYKKFLEEIVRKKEHTLSEKEERILAMSQEATSAPNDIFSMFNNADIKFGEIEDEEGNKVELTKGRYIPFMESKVRAVRKQAYETLYKEFGKYKNTLAAAYTSQIKSLKFYAKARNYESSLQASLDQDNIKEEVLDNLIESINDYLPLLHRYVKVRAKALGMEKISMYDIYVPIVDQDTEKYTYEQGCELVKDGLKVLGNDYQELLEKAMTSKWIDVYENEGKTSGAYSWGTYLSHPYILLNYSGTLDSVYTLAHELGHSMHSYYSNHNQSYINSHYKIFVAEVASTVNEILLLKHMLAITTDSKKRAFLLNHFLESFRGTVFRQTMFAEYERDTNQSFNNDIPLSSDDLCSMYKEINSRYYGEACESDELISYEWSRIPHFYMNFYVYKYATGFLSAVAIVDAIEKQGEKAVDRYKEFLKSGGSDYPMELLKKAGVDLTDRQPIMAGMKMFEEILDEFENML